MVDSTNPRVMADNIKELDAGNMANADAIEALGSYSTTEVDTGMKYDNSNIYRKIFTVDALPNATDLVIPHGVTNLGQVMELRGIATGESAGRPFDYRNLIWLTFTNTNIVLTTSADYSTSSAIIIFEYTKAPAGLLAPNSDDMRTIEPEEPINEELKKEEK